MTPYQIRADLRHCHIGARYIFLDLATDRYFMFDGSAARRFAAFESDEATGEDLRWLIAHGILEPGNADRRQSASSSGPPSASVLDDAPGHISPWLVGEALITLTLARRQLSRKPLAELLNQHISGAPDPERSRLIASAFQRTARYVAAKDQCLLRSMSLRSMLARRGIAVELIIGVTLPFSAHCWVQSGPLVLSDPLDRVIGYKPLLVVP